jgi:hypothetical protein
MHTEFWYGNLVNSMTESKTGRRNKASLGDGKCLELTQKRIRLSGFSVT